MAAVSGIRLRRTIRRYARHIWNYRSKGDEATMPLIHLYVTPGRWSKGELLDGNDADGSGVYCRLALPASMLYACGCFQGTIMIIPIESRIEERFRLYVDESGDHVFRYLEEVSHRFLCLLGCWIRIQDNRLFHGQLEALKQRHFPHNPDDPLVLHREDILNRRGSFWRLRDKQATDSFDGELLELIEQTHFRMCAVVIDKKALRERYPVPSHPYHLAMGFLLQRYCGFLNHISRYGDVMAESRGGREDHRLKASYEWVFQRGVWMNRAEFFQRCLTSKELKLKPKSANVAGLQLADLLAHPVKQSILIEKGLVAGALSPFAKKLQGVFEKKYNRQLYSGEIGGYGKVLFPS